MEEAVPAEAGHRATGPERCFAELALDSVLDDLQVRLEADRTLRKHKCLDIMSFAGQQHGIGICKQCPSLPSHRLS